MMEKLDFETSRGFDWDKRKSRSNLDKHGIDFDDAVEIFYGPVILRRSDRNSEERWIAIGSPGKQIHHRGLYTTGRCLPDNLGAPRKEK
jgi:hypothetical protein